MEDTKELITTDDIRSKVYIIRGQQVMLDKDLAEIYGYEVKRLNEQVKRNISRFPEDFMFQLNREEIPEGFSKSQFATLNEKSNRQGSNIKKMPFAFTEQGIYMLATVLRGELAEQQSIFIMRTFREMRHYIKQNQQFVTRSEMELLSSKVTEISVQTTGLIDKQKQTDQKVNLIQKNVEQLSENFISEKDVKNFVIYKGQKLEADIAYIEIYQQAKKSIYVVDDYMNAKSLQHLSQKADGVEVVLFTENGKGGRGFLTNSLVTDFQNEYPTIRIKPNPDCHDRLIILDYPIESFEIVGVVIGGAAKAISSIRSRSSNSARNTTQQVDSSAANTSIVEKVADIVEKTNRSLPCENDVSGHKQRYHTKNGVIWKNKAPYHRGGNNG